MARRVLIGFWSVLLAAHAATAAIIEVTTPTEFGPGCTIRDAIRSVGVEAGTEIIVGFTLTATRGTAAFLRVHGIDVEVIYKVNEGRPTSRIRSSTAGSIS